VVFAPPNGLISAAENRVYLSRTVSSTSCGLSPFERPGKGPVLSLRVQGKRCLCSIQPSFSRQDDLNSCISSRLSTWNWVNPRSKQLTLAGGEAGWEPVGSREGSAFESIG
jgi:hypothetical protein